MKEFTIKDFIRAFLDHIVLVVLIPFVAVAVTAFVCGNILPPTYTASTSVYVLSAQGENQPQYSDVTMSALLMNDYQAFVRTRRVRDSAAAMVGLEDLSEYSVNISAETNTRLFYVNVTGKDAKMAADVANAIADVLSQCIQEVANVENISILDKAVVPLKPSGPNMVRSSLMAGVIGLFISVLLAILIEMGNTKIRNAEDVEKILELPVLAQIPRREEKGEMDRNVIKQRST